MFRLMLPCALACAAIAFCADPPKGTALWSDAAKKPEPTKTVIKLTLHPQAAPVPATRYSLLPTLRESVPGNQVQGFMKCFSEQNNFYFHKSSIDEREKYNEAKLADLKGKDLKGYGGSSLRYADDAARMASVDWQMLHRLRAEGIETLLPDVQGMRMLAGANRVRIRGSIADGRFDDAVKQLSTQFALGRTFETHPTLIGGLVGIAIITIGVGTAEELIAQPGAPNLYWALAELPSPMISLRTGMQGERMFMDATFGKLPATRVASADELEDFLKDYVRVMSLGVIEGQTMTAQEMVALARKKAGDAKHVEAARKRLVADGKPAAKIAKMPALQVVILDEMREFEARMGEVQKWNLMPFYEGEKRLKETPTGEPTMFAELLPSNMKVVRAKARLTQRIGMLTVAEAIRLYAAEKGSLPPSLKDLTVPVPLDAVSGKEYVYAAKGDTATLTAGPPKGMEKVAGFNTVYEITLAKK